jgi:hypothetical protein
MGWWELEEHELSKVDQLDRQRAYFEQLMESLQGQQVLGDMRRLAKDYSFVGTASELAVARMALADFMDRIRQLCGVQDEVKVVEAEANVARSFEPIPQEQVFSTVDDVYVPDEKQE